jgi:hypothetical protein
MPASGEKSGLPRKLLPVFVPPKFLKISNFVVF